MALISVILPAESTRSPRDDRSDIRETLHALGHEVEFIDCIRRDLEARSTPVEDDADRDSTTIRGTFLGIAPAAIAGLDAATGSILVVVDPARGYTATDLAAVVEPLVRDDAEIAVGYRGESSRLWPRSVLRRAFGSADPFSGLIALDRDTYTRGKGRFQAVGSRFTLELLTRLDGRVEDAAISSRPAGSAGGLHWNDLRQLKRLADHRFGNFSRLVQFCAVGGSGMIVDLFCYVLFQPLFGRFIPSDALIAPTRVPWYLAIARVSAIAIALCWNFALNRRLTFSYARRGSLPAQFLLYAASNALSIGVSLALSLGLPSWSTFFRAHKLAAAVAGIVVATGISFSMSRWLVFRDPARQRSSVRDSTPANGRPREHSAATAKS